MSLESRTSGRQSRMAGDLVLERTQRLLSGYAIQRIRPTVRQIYYRFVGERWAEPGDYSYKRITQVLSEARYQGLIPLDALADLTRRVREGDVGFLPARTSVLLDDAVRLRAELPSLLCRPSRWANQPVQPHIWVEKEALSSFIGPICEGLGVPYFPIRGNVGPGGLGAWLENVGSARAGETWSRTAGPFRYHSTAAQQASRLVVLYFGDHDPNGLAIPRAAEVSLRELLAVRDQRLVVEFRRIGLTVEQIEAHHLPGFALKTSDKRAPAYRAETGLDLGWELDALPPDVLDGLIRAEVGRYFDPQIARDAEASARDAEAWLRGELAELGGEA